MQYSQQPAPASGLSEPRPDEQRIGTAVAIRRADAGPPAEQACDVDVDATPLGDREAVGHLGAIDQDERGFRHPRRRAAARRPRCSAVSSGCGELSWLAMTARARVR